MLHWSTEIATYFGKLAASDEVATVASPTVVLLASAVAGFGESDEAISVLRTASRMHPDDFWINYSLAHQLHGAQPPRLEERIQCSRVALALRPKSAAAALLFALALAENGASDEAIAEHREAIRLNPDYALAHNNLGVALRAKAEVNP